MTLDWEMCEDFKNYTWWQLAKQMLRIISETAKKFCSYYCAFVISDSIQLWYVVHSTQLQSSPLAGKGFLHACRGYIHFGQKISVRKILIRNNKNKSKQAGSDLCIYRIAVIQHNARFYFNFQDIANKFPTSAFFYINN